MQEILCKYRLSLSFVVADLVAFYKRNILDPFGSLLSAIYLQCGENSKYPKLDLTLKDQLGLWVMCYANFGYSDSALLSCTCKNMITHFSVKYFPDGMHKLNSKDISLIKQLLEASYSDDILIPVFINMIYDENINPTFQHPDNWPELTDLEKAHLLV